jgi:hypothetical protein
VTWDPAAVLSDTERTLMSWAAGTGTKLAADYLLLAEDAEPDGDGYSCAAASLFRPGDAWWDTLMQRTPRAIEARPLMMRSALIYLLVVSWQLPGTEVHWTTTGVTGRGGHPAPLRVRA